MPFLGLLSSWRLIAAGVALAALLGAFLYVSHLRSTIEDQRGQLAVAQSAINQAHAINEENVKELDKIKADYIAARNALLNARNAEKSRDKVINDLKDRIYNAPKSEDGPVAPILNDTLERLRPKSNAIPSDEDSRGKTAGPRRTALLR